MDIKLSTLSVLLGSLMSLLQVYGLLQPESFAEKLRKFPRSLPWGFALMLLGTAWFLYYLNLESIADFASFKPVLMFGFGAVGVASCFFVQDYLAVRGAAVVMLLLAKLMLDAARWSETDWHWVISAWAYVLVVGGIWFTVWPWNMRDLIHFFTANTTRVRLGSVVRLAFGLLLVGLGLSAFRAG